MQRHEQLGLFANLPKDIFLLLIRRYLGYGVFNLARASHTLLTRLTTDETLRVTHFRDLTLLDAQIRNDLEILKQLNTINPIRRLLSHATLGEWESAEAIWSKDYSLVNCRGTVFAANSNRYKAIQLTCWQIALINEEFEEADNIGKWMSKTQKCKQFMEVFPTGKMVKSNWDYAKAKELLLTVFTAIIHDETISSFNLDAMNDNTRAALDALYDYIKPAREHKTGLVFDAKFYLAALQQYEDNFKKFKSWSRRTFWCIRVEEHIAAFLGTAYLRPHAQGIGNPLTRRGCILANGSSYFPLNSNKSLVPGVHFFVGYLGQRCDEASRMHGGMETMRQLCSGAYKTYIHHKQTCGQAYTNKYAHAAINTECADRMRHNN